jgi:hypothetical protein
VIFAGVMLTRSPSWTSWSPSGVKRLPDRVTRILYFEIVPHAHVGVEELLVRGVLADLDVRSETTTVVVDEENAHN